MKTSDHLILPVKNPEPAKSEWMHRHKTKIIYSIVSVLTVTIVITMIVIALTLRARLIEDSRNKTVELSEVIGSSLRQLMLVRNTGRIEETLERIGRKNPSIARAFILDNHGKVAYSSDPREIGNVIDRFSDASCDVCHTGPEVVPVRTTLIVSTGKRDILRNVNVIWNEKQCYGCHAPSDRVNGKLIIDRSVEPTYALIANIELILALSGGLCLIVLVPVLWKLLSRGVNTYIHEVDSRSTELSMLYMIVERLSKTIEIEELKHIVVETINELFKPDEIHIILPREGGEYSGVVWTHLDDRIERRRGPGEDPYREEIIAWLDGDLREIELSRDKKTVFVPVTKGESRLALIIIRKEDGSLTAPGMNLLKAMGSHIAVAFENAALYRIAITDELTGLYTKRHFRHTIEKKFDVFEHCGEKLSLLMIDIDNFKAINDTYGHPAGDLVLKDVAHCVLQSTRVQDFDFRYGGEEFAVILPATDLAAASQVADRIRDIVARASFTVNDAPVRITVSIGVSSCPKNARTIRDLVLEADRALYEAKRTGKDRVVTSRMIAVKK